MSTENQLTRPAHYFVTEFFEFGPDFHSTHPVTDVLIASGRFERETGAGKDSG